MSLLSFMASFAGLTTVALADPTPSSEVSTTIVASGTDLEWNERHLQYHLGDLGHRAYHTTKEEEHQGWHAAHDDSVEEGIYAAEHRHLHKRMNHAHRVTHWGTTYTVTCVPYRFPWGVC